MSVRLTRTVLVALIASFAQPAYAQFRWNGDGTVDLIEPRRSPQFQDTWQDSWSNRPYPPRQFQGPSRLSPQPPAGGGEEVRDGGPRPDVQPQTPAVASFPHAYPAGSIVIDVQARQLYYVLPGNQAFAYQVSVGREGFGWTGTEVVTRKQAWPDWHPPAEMRARDPRLPVKMTGGVNNPLGAIALYLGNTLYRIHGTNDETSLGQASSSGCFRMMNASVLHLASITEVGTRVHVVEALAPQQRLSGVQPAPVAPPAYMAAPRPAQRPPRRDTWYEWEPAPWERSPWERAPRQYPPFQGWR